jgi:hypothetical protein
MSELPITPRTKLKRRAQRGSYDRAQVDAILDEGLICHVGFVHRGQACAIPTIYARAGDSIFLHGSTANRMLRAVLEPGRETCLCVTLVDGLVFARSAFHSSMNYRSVVLYGQAEEVTDPVEKHEALRTVVEHAMPGRWKDVRQPNREEQLRTLVLRLPIVEGSAKVRAGGPIEDPEDLQLGCWAGVLPVRTSYGPPVPDSQLAAGIEVPDCVARYARGGPS